MYDIALFIHVLGVTLLAAAIGVSATCYVAARRATEVAQLRTALHVLPAMDRLMPFAIPLILLAGLYMVSRHGDDNEISWSSAWVVVSLVMFAVMAPAGAAIEGRRMSAVRRQALDTPDGPIPPELDALRRDRVVQTVMFFGFAMFSSFLFLMTVKPQTYLRAIAVPVVAVIVFLAVAELVFRRTATSTVTSAATQPSAGQPL